MKNSVMMVLVVLLMPLMVFGGESGLSEEDRAEKSKIILGIRILIGKERKKAENYSVERSVLVNEMLKDEAGHQKRKASLEKIRNLARKLYTERYRTRAEGILYCAERTKPDSIDRLFSDEEKKKWLTPPTDIINENIRKTIVLDSGIFKEAREEACKKQWDQIFGKIYPTEKEYENAYGDKKKLERLRRTLLARIREKHGKPLFEENVGKNGDKLLDPMLNDAGIQLRGQRKMFEDAAKSNPYLIPKDIEDYIRGKLKELRDKFAVERKGKEISHVYGVFPSIESGIRERSKLLALEKFRESISGMTGVSEEEIQKFISGNLAEHVRKESSKELCLRHFSSSVRKLAVERHVESAPKEKRTELRKFIEEALAKGDRLGDELNSIVRKSVLKNFDQARKKITQEQLGKFFSPLADGTWKPSYEEIDGYYNKGEVKITNPFRLSGVSSGEFDEKKILDETRAKVLEKENAAIKRGLDALRKQMSIVEEKEDEVRDYLKSSSELPALEEVIGFYTNKVTEKWSEIPNQKEYKHLFKRATEDIERRSKALLLKETVRKKDAQKKLAEAAEKKGKSSKGQENSIGGGGSGGNGSPGGGGAGDGKTEGAGKGSGGGILDAEGFMPNLIIDLDYRGDVIGVTMIFPDSDFATKRFNMRVDDLKTPRKQPMELVLMEPSLAQWMVNFSSPINDESEPKVFILVRVFDGRVYYGAVYKLRECFKRARNLMGIFYKDRKPPKIYWYDGLFEKKERGKKGVPPKIEKKQYMMCEVVHAVSVEKT